MYVPCTSICNDDQKVIFILYTIEMNSKGCGLSCSCLFTITDQEAKMVRSNKLAFVDINQVPLIFKYQNLDYLLLHEIVLKGL